MTTQTATLADWLLARIAEDEAAARRAGSFTPWSETFQNDNYGHLTIQPSRVLAECEAKRLIVGRHDVVDVTGGCAFCGEPAPCEHLRFLASVYADSPDFQEAWR